MKVDFVIKRDDQEAKTISLNNGAVMAAAVAVVLFVFALAGGSLQLYRAYTEKQELMVYREQYGQYTERLQKLIEDNEKMQKELAQVATLEKQVSELLEKDKKKQVHEVIDKTSQELDKQGQGGQSTVTRLEILEVQNKLTEKRIAYKRENLSNMLVQLSGKDFDNGEYRWPIDDGEISSYYGFRVDPFGGFYGEFHSGMDIAVSYGAPIHATASGTVEVSGWNGGYGNYVRLAHGNGMESAYGHMSAVAVSPGQKVQKGEVIGYVGSSGASTGPHVHFEILEQGEQINPLHFVQPR